MCSAPRADVRATRPLKFKDLTEADATAIARYLKTAPPIANKVR